MVFACAAVISAICVSHWVEYNDTSHHGLYKSAILRGHDWFATVDMDDDALAYLNPKKMAKACVKESCVLYVVHCDKPTSCAIRTGYRGHPGIEIEAKTEKAMAKAFQSIAIHYEKSDPIPLTLFTQRSPTTEIGCISVSDPTSEPVRDAQGRRLTVNGRMRMSGHAPVWEDGCDYVPLPDGMVWDQPAPKPDRK